MTQTPAHHYAIIDRHTGRTVGKATTLSGARRSVDRRDNEWGAYRFGWRRVDGEK